MRLGELILELNRLPLNLPVRFRTVGRVESVPNGASVGRLAGYRGFYDRLAFATAAGERTVGEVLDEARAAVGAVFQGYKGGDYEMSEQTVLHAAEYGESYGDQIVAVEDGSDRVWLVVAHAEEW